MELSKNEIEQIEKNNQSITERATSLVIADEKTQNEAVDYLSGIARAKKDLEEKRVFFVKPLNDQVKKINEFFKKYSTPLLEADGILRRKMVDYRTVLRKIEEEKNRKALELAKSVGIEQEELDMEVKPEAAKTESGTVSGRKVMRFELVDENKVPREYLTVDASKIRKGIAAGVREIDGIRIWEDEDISVTTH